MWNKNRAINVDWKRLGRVFVVIDAANLEHSVKSLGWWVDYKKLFTFFKANTRLVGIRHYCPSFNPLRRNPRGFSPGMEDCEGCDFCCGDESLGFSPGRFNDERQNSFFTVLKKTGFKLITKPLKVITETDKAKGDIRKANFDVEITVDTMVFLEGYDTLVLFSGDSDFNSLIKHLRQNGKHVIIVSSRYHISKELIESSNKYIDLKKLRGEIERKK